MKTFIKVSILVLLATGILFFLSMFSFNFIAKNVINALKNRITEKIFAFLNFEEKL